MRRAARGWRASVAAACALALLAGCATEPQLYSMAHHHVIDLDPGALEEGGLAFITPSMPFGKEEDKQVIALIFGEVLTEQRPAIPVRMLPETLGLVNSNGLAKDYRAMYEDYRDTGIFRREYLAEVGQVTGARYVAQINLGDFDQGTTGRFSVFGLRLLSTKWANARLFFQIWDSSTGKIAWEGVQEMNYAYDTAKEETVTFRSVIEASALDLIKALPAATEVE
jgi:hypothetical protein